VSITAKAERSSLNSIRMGLGAWSWGDRVVWQYGRGFGPLDVGQAFSASIAEGIGLVDTAEVYGSGRSERLLGELIAQAEVRPLIATKFFPWPWKFSRESFQSALRASLGRLHLPAVDLYQVHRPTPLINPETLMQWMADSVEAGLVQWVGVSNFGQRDMLRAYSELARRKLMLASNQLHFSLLSREVERNGLLARCNELGVRLIAYSPLEMGLLTGKYDLSHPPPGNRALRYANILGRIQPLLKLMTDIGQDHGGKSNAQVALAWVLAKGALPIPGAKNAAQAIDNAGALSWSLGEKEVQLLDLASDAAH
jgi:aryl-alcohol dehydrogenase-like predicted oxidoreductase